MLEHSFQRPQLVRDKVYTFLRREIFLGALPPGEPLREQELSKQLAVSRTPVREALNQLLQEGLLEPSQHSARGLQVRNYSPKDASDTYEVRELLELRTARLAAQADASQPEVQRLHQALQQRIAEDAAQDDPVKHIENDLSLHALIATLSGNEALRDMTERLTTRLLSLRTLTRLEIGSSLSQQQHHAIVAAIIDADADAAEAAMRRHILTFKEIVRQRLQESAEPPQP